ncbi:uncharacterized protein LOC133193169 [Saccostrea echinata]|uniref:uncharacterized protein LOC133193169 n=1 Tax=Saccostrea echinata TaxID=191078 RepID=UPI002A83532E|nr:uncharacterized protein LOC133193169 [Saccostrea echinata]
MEIILYIPSNISEENERLLPPEIEVNECQDDLTSIWPVSVLVYFQGQKENLELIKKEIRRYQNNKWSSEIIVLSPETKYGSQSVAQNTFTVVDCNKKSIREAISRCLEAPVSQYLKVKKTVLKYVVEESYRCRLQEEILSLQTLLSETTPGKPVRRIPKKIKDYLFGNPSVLGFALWEGKTLRITVKNTKCKYDLEQELKALDTERNFLQSHMLEILEGNVKVSLYVGQGDKLYPGHEICDLETNQKRESASANSKDMEENYGTLGSFLEEKTSKDLYGITCRHVIPQENEKVFMKILKNKPPSEIGQSVYTSEKNLEDFAVFKVNDYLKDQCIKTFHNDDDEECNAVVHQGNVSDNLVVHKKGATTGWTTGRIQSRECYSHLVPDENEVFLVDGFDKDFFACTGDSGSVVFTRDKSFDQSTVSVLGMVLGGMESNYEDHQPEIEKSTMCFPLDNALSNLSIQNRLKLEFVPKEQSSSDSD